MSDCGIVKDLLPLYADDVCSIESKKLVAEHLSECEECCKELESYELNVITGNVAEKEAVKKFKKKTERKILKKIVSVMLVLAIGTFGVANVIWFAAVKMPYNRYASKWEDYLIARTDRETPPFIEAVLGENNSYGIDAKEYENMGIIMRKPDYLQNNGTIFIYSDMTARIYKDEITYTDEGSTEKIFPSLTVSRGKAYGYGRKGKGNEYRFCVHFEPLIDEDLNDIYFYVDENMNLILPAAEEYANEYYKYHDDHIGEEKAKEYLKQYTLTHNPIREELYEQYYEDIRVMMIVLHEAFGIGNVKA